MKIYKYFIQYNVYKKGKNILIKSNIITNDDEETVINIFTLQGLRNFKITSIKKLN
jgi:hypothetical protein